MTVHDNPDHKRTSVLFDDLICQTEIEGGDMRSIASSALMHAAEFYRAVHGSSGPDGVVAALSKLVAMNAERDAREHDEKRFGAGGNA